MAKVDAKILKGFKDYLPEEMIPRQEIIFKVIKVFESYGYSPLETPALEYAETLVGKYGDEGEKQLYRFKDNGGRDVGLRFDLTVPLARVVAMYQNDIPLPFKRYQIQTVYRAEKPQKGRFREFYQCDVDCVGTSSMLADAEYIQIASDLFKELGVKDYQVKINNRKVLNGLFEYAGVKKNQVNDVFAAIDKLPKIGEAGVVEELNKIKLSKDQVAKIMDFAKITGKNIDIISKLEKLIGGTESGRQGILELTQVVDYLTSAKITDKYCAIDLSIARGLEYYTGTVYETFIGGAEKLGSVFSGGRYDDLIGMFLNKKIPAIGYSLGLDRLFVVLQEIGLIKVGKKTPAQVLVTIFDGSTIAKAISVAKQIRAKGINVELYTGDGDLGKQFKYADKLGIPYVVVIGPDEIRDRKITIKDLNKKTQITIPESQLDKEISKF